MIKKRDNFLSNIYKLYIFFLPFNKFDIWPFPDFLARYLFINISTLFLWIGLVYIIVTKRKLPFPHGIKIFLKIYLFMTIYSLIAALILFYPLGTLNGENTFRAVIGDIVFYFIAIGSIYFNFYCLSYVLKFEELRVTLIVQVISVLLVGYIQYGVILGIGGFNIFYNIIRNIIFLLPSDQLNRGVVFGGTEPSSASNLCFLTLPYLFCNLLSKDMRLVDKIGYVTLIIMFVPLFLSSDSSSVMLSYIMLFITFIAIYVGNKTLLRMIAIVSFCIGAFVAIGYGIDTVSNYVVGLERGTWQYIAFGKIFDTSDLSNIMRSSTIVNDMKIFFANPLTGVGNGLQGYFYEENLPDWAYVSFEVQNLLQGNNGIVDGGGAFFPTYLSAFGFIGIIVFYFFIREYIKLFNFNTQYMGIEKNIFFIFLVIFLSSAWYSLGVKQNQYVAVMLSLPIVNYESNWILSHNCEERKSV